MVEFFIAGDNYDRRKIEQMLFPKDETAKTMERVYPWNWTFFFLATHLATADLGLEPQSTLSHFRSCKMDLTSNNSKEFPRGHIAEKVKMPVTVVVLKY